MEKFKIYFHFFNGNEFLDLEIQFELMLPFIPQKRQVFHIDCALYEPLEKKLNESEDEGLKDRYSDYKYHNGYSFDDCIYVDCVCIKVDQNGESEIHCELASDRHPMKILVNRS